MNNRNPLINIPYNVLGIYKITSPDNKVYIGQSRNIKIRCHQHSKRSKSPHIRESFTKYDKRAHSFSVVHELPSDVPQEIFDIYEQLYMELYKDCGVILLNDREGGKNGKQSEAAINKLKNSIKGRVISPEQRAKITASLKGRPYHGKNKGKVRSQEAKDKTRKTILASIKNKGSKCKQSKLTESQVLEIRSKYKYRVYTSLRLSKEYNITESTIKDILKRKSWNHILNS